MTREGDTYRVIARQAESLEKIAKSLGTIAATAVQQTTAGLGDLIKGDAEKAAPCVSDCAYCAAVYRNRNSEDKPHENAPDVGVYMDPDAQPPPPTDGWLDPVEPDDPEEGGPEQVDWTGGSKR